jgi:hypothetical protein
MIKFKIIYSFYIHRENVKFALLPLEFEKVINFEESSKKAKFFIMDF